MAQDVAVVMVPFPAHGHLNQLLNVSLLLSARGLAIHYAASPSHIRQAKSRLQGWRPASLHAIHFHNLPIPSFPTPLPAPNAATKFPNHLQPLWESTLHLHSPLISLLHSLSALCRSLIVVYDPLVSFTAQEAPPSPLLPSRHRPPLTPPPSLPGTGTHAPPHPSSSLPGTGNPGPPPLAGTSLPPPSSLPGTRNPGPPSCWDPPSPPPLLPSRNQAPPLLPGPPLPLPLFSGPPLLPSPPPSFSEPGTPLPLPLAAPTTAAGLQHQQERLSQHRPAAHRHPLSGPPGPWPQPLQPSPSRPPSPPQAPQHASPEDPSPSAHPHRSSSPSPSRAPNSLPKSQYQSRLLLPHRPLPDRRRLRLGRVPGHSLHALPRELPSQLRRRHLTAAPTPTPVGEGAIEGSVWGWGAGLGDRTRTDGERQEGIACKNVECEV